MAAVAQHDLARKVIVWQKKFGRHGLPWQNTTDAYRIWLSEIMLQQTQVAAVINYYQKFLTGFPTIEALANAPIDSVLAHWAGLGYYTRARNLHRCAQLVCERHGGIFPNDQAALIDLPGIGRSTAAAILAFAYGTSTPILDGNVKRVFCRFFAIEGFPGETKNHNALWLVAEREMPTAGVQAYTQGLMDLGATVCKLRKPECHRCPLNADCAANAKGLQSQLPEPRPKKVVPTKEHWFVLLRNAQGILLQRQPDQGIWGGLYSLPRVEPTENLVDLGQKLADSFGLKPMTLVEGPSFNHAFTHYKLRARVFHAQVSHQQLSARADDAVRFCSPEEIAQLGLPKPISVYIAKLA
jgi:A/G-specific adenine glycosylase